LELLEVEVEQLCDVAERVVEGVQVLEPKLFVRVDVPGALGLDVVRIVLELQERGAEASLKDWGRFLLTANGVLGIGSLWARTTRLPSGQES
jgi:hypothetical protein